jgi:hypothetical protein
LPMSVPNERGNIESPNLKDTKYDPF